MGAILAKLALGLFSTALGPLADMYKAKLAAGTSADNIAKELAGRELAVQQREEELAADVRIAEIGRWYEPDHLIGYLVALLIAKLIVWDTVLGWGVTKIGGSWIESLSNTVVMFYFGKRGIENVTRIIGSFRK